MIWKIIVQTFILSTINNFVKSNQYFDPISIYSPDENNIEEKSYSERCLIFPGTKWCGAGNISGSYDDLGDFAEVDKCCREHDYCPDIIEGHKMKYGLNNPTSYTRLNCKCDITFQKCLKIINNNEANFLGSIYFNILNTQCYRFDYPIIECTKKLTSSLVPKCIEYKFDKSGKKIYQWFDVPAYSTRAN